MVDLQNRHTAHRLACSEAVNEIAKHDLPLARSAARVLSVSMPAHDTSALLAELRAEQKQRRRVTLALVWLSVVFTLAAFLAWFAAPDIAAWQNGLPPITGGQND